MQASLPLATTGSPTPLLDSRNTSFISPTRLQHLREKPRHHFTSSSNKQTAPSPPMATTEHGQRPPAGPQHSRASSFFSFRSKETNGANNGPQRTPSLLSRSTSNNPSGSPTPANMRPVSSPLSMNGIGSDLARSASAGQPAQPALHPEIRSVVGLTVAQAHKIYFSGPLVRKIERGGDGQKPTKDEGWNEVWAQLGGTTLSIWDMKLIQEASTQGKEVPPTYVNVTDAFVSVLGSITVPATATTPAQRYSNVLTLNTAGSNLLLFSCPSTEALISWAASLRLCAWEKSRLEEIYTAHLIRITLSARDIPSTLVRGRMEGWARIRIAGQTDWKRVWMVVSTSHEPETLVSATSVGATPTTLGSKKKRMSALFARDASPTRVGPSKANVAMYLSQKPKDRKKALLTMADVSQAFAVYPERPELISRSTLIKVEGRMGTEDVAAGMRGREGWILIMPELEGGLGQAAEMLKWVVAFHDAFQLYGRPQAWTWDPREPSSLMFAYPVGPQKDLLFLDRELAETLDPRDDGTSTIRSRLLNILFDRMRGVQPTSSSDQGSNGVLGPGPQLPPLSFDNMQPQTHERHLLTPITEKSSVYTHGRAMSVDTQSVLAPRQSLYLAQSPVVEESSSSSLLPDRAATPVQSPLDYSRDKDMPSIPSSQSGNTFSNLPESSTARRSLDQESSHSPRPQRIQSPPSFVNGSAFRPANSSSPPSTSPRIDFSQSRTDSTNSPSSVLTSPFSVGSPNGSVMTSPYSMRGRDEAIPPPPVSPRMQPASSFKSNNKPVSQGPRPSTPSATDEGLGNEAGALYFMQYENSSQAVAPSTKLHQQSLRSRVDESDEDSDSDDVPPSNSRFPTGSNPSQSSQRAPLRQGTPMAFVSERNSTGVTLSDRASPTSMRQGLGRKPSGARAPSNKTSSQAPNNVNTVSEELSDQEDSMDLKDRAAFSPDEDLDALAALSYLQMEERDVPPPTTKPLAVRQTALTPPPAPPSDVANQFKSSFAPSKQAAERKARAEAKEAAHQVAVHRPGRANARKKKDAGWNESSDEDEDEDDDDEDDDADSDRDPGAPASIRPPASTDSHRPPPRSVQSHTQHDLEQQQPHLRPPRNLPQIPGARQPEYDEYSQPPYAQRQRVNSDVRSDAGRFTQYNDMPPIRTQFDQPPQQTARHNMWSQVLEPGHQNGVLHGNERDTFVQLESPSQTMTKAFTPQGLLSAGMQDKSDRSAKRQEEVARETGASLINVPHKPPPPQTGLLGAISAHERDRKRDGGVGAALTEREREKRLAEERQRRFDDQQRQQMEQMQTGSMYGGFNNPYGMMGGNPMMMGMNPMMTGQGLSPMMTGQGMNPMMMGFNPQMFAQQAAAQQVAAQAYQQAMMTFSVAGSQAGGAEQNVFNPGGAFGAGGMGFGGQQPMNPMMTGGGMFDPRMSIMSGFNGMGMGMGMGGMGSPMMGAQMGGLPMGSPMGMNLPAGASASNFDPRFPPGGTPSPQELLPPNVLASPKQNASGGVSSVGRGSPLARAVDVPNTSRPTSPKP